MEILRLKKELINNKYKIQGLEMENKLLKFTEDSQRKEIERLEKIILWLSISLTMIIVPLMFWFLEWLAEKG